MLIPIADGQAGEIRRAQGGGFGDFGSDDGDAEQVGLKLQKQIVGRRPTVGAEFGDGDAGIELHGLDTSATWKAMLSSAARARWAAVVPRVRPKMVPRA